MRICWFDLETRSPVPIKHGTWAYAEQAEVMLFAYAQDGYEVKVWDRMNGTVNWQDELSGLWESVPCTGMPVDLHEMVEDRETLFWGHNATAFDWPVLQHAMPDLAVRVAVERRRDSMILAYCHGMPGALDKLGAALNIAEDKRKSKRGRTLIQVFCKPNKDGGWNTAQTHPEDWAEFVAYAAGDITTMREAVRLLPTWNYKGRHLELAHIDAKINARGFAVDRELATAALRATAAERARLAASTQALTDGEVQAATQRDALMKHILTAHGVELPDMRSDTLERRLQDENLPDTVKQLIVIRLQASMNSVSKYTALLKGVSSDGRLRGGAQFRGAFRTGRWAHRLFQHGNMPRMDAEAIGRWWGIPANKVKDKHIRKYVESGIASLLEGCEDLTHGEVMRLCSMTVRGVIIAPPGKKLVVADLSNIEGRVAAWLAGEGWKLQAFRDYDTIIGTDAEGEPIRKGPDLYRLAYARAFQIPVEEVTKDQRQIGKVMELMLQYGGGVGAFLTGAATYGIDLEQMADAAYPSLPADVVEEAAGFLAWLYETALEKKRDAAKKRNKVDPDFDASTIHLTEAEMLECRLGLTERVFVVCDSLKRMWRRAHPAISSYWGELEDAVKYVINTPGETVVCRKVKVRRDGGWLRIALPSGRALCYPAPQIDKKTGAITYMGLNQYTRQWERLNTYGGKLLENCLSGDTEVLTEAGWRRLRSIQPDQRVWDGVEWVHHAGLSHRGVAATLQVFNVWMTPDHKVLTAQGWMYASSCKGHDRFHCRLPEGFEVSRQRWSEVDMGVPMRLQGDVPAGGFGSREAQESRCGGVLRVHARSDSVSASGTARPFSASRLRGVGQHESSLHTKITPRLASVWRARHQSVQAVVGLVRRFLGRHGSDVSAGAHVGAQAEQWQLHTEQLQMGHSARASVEQVQDAVHCNPARTDVGGASGKNVRAEVHDVAVPTGPRVEPNARFEPTYDLINCGPRHRFVVRGSDGVPLVVHNCVQAVACDQLGDCMPAIEAAGYPLIFHVHDEDAAEVPDDPRWNAEELARLMCANLGWNVGLPLAAAGFETYRYRKE